MAMFPDSMLLSTPGRSLKRGVVGTYHQVSRKYLPLYVAEFQFRYNNRHNSDIFGHCVGQC